jgi:DnaJ like chaperone protein
MAAKNFFDALRDSINQIVSGEEKTGPSEGEKQRKQSSQNEIEAAVIVLATEVMRLDGNYSSETKKILSDFLEKNFGKISSAKRNKLVNDHLFVGPQPFTKMACEQLKSLTTHGSKHEIIKLLYEIASLDDFISAKENSVINKIARYLEISLDELRALREKFSRINDPYAILEMEETTSVTEVKAAYRKVVLKYHPDKRTDKTTDEEANRKFREVKKAFEMIMKKIVK